MYSDSTLDDGYHNGISIDTTTAANLRKAGKWARFIGLTCLIMTAIGILPFIFAGGTIFSQPEFSALAAFGSLFYVFIVAILLFALYIYYLIFDFGRKAVAAVDHNDQQSMQASIASLSRFFLITGILVALYLAIIGGLMIIGLVGGAIGAAI